MDNISMPVNRHIVDQLADVREQIKQLEARENDLKSQVSTAMGGADSLGGDEYIARQTISSRAGSIDAKALKGAGVDVDRYRKPGTTVFSIKVERRALSEGV